MSTVDLIEELKKLDSADRLAVIEAASRLVRQDLAPLSETDRRLREQALAVRDLYESGGELTEWTSLDAEDVIDDCLSR
jgi:hypothetical protein